MQRQVPTWVAVVVIVAVIVVVALVYLIASQRGGGGPVQPTGTIPPPGQKGGTPYERPIPPGAPPFMKQRPGGQ